jgi:predicted transposase/invertase (TIGR01784 family)
MYDPTCKFLAERYSLDFARWILGREIVLTQLSSSELSLEPIRADAVILLESSEEVLHLEFQKEPDPDMAFRMLDYRTRVYRRFPNKEMRQVVIYLKKTGSELVEQTAFALSKTRHEFEVIKLWEIPPEELREGLGLLPLVVLGKTEDREETLKRVAEKIDLIENRQEKSNIAAATAILAGLVLNKEVIQKLLREDIMKESVIYQDILAQGEVKGKAEGRQEEAASLILRQLNRRCGEIHSALSQQVQSLSVEQLEQLGEDLLDFTSVEDLVNWLSEGS